MRARFMLFAALSTVCLTLSACELQEVTTAESEDVVITELVLRAGDTVQTAFLHRTITLDRPATVTGADIVVEESGSASSIRFLQADDSLCLGSDAPIPAVAGTCYAARVPVTAIKPATRYMLRVTLPDRRVMTGTTDVPASFTITNPPTAADATPAACRLDVGKSFAVTWTRAAGASVYLSEARFHNLRQSLRATGVNVEGERDVELSGLSISATDTTLLFPGDLGLFDRFDDDVIDVLLAIRDGLPPDVDGTVVIAAADRNYVNWVRGGNFNPSGSVHISSIRGDGEGVFGSLVARTALISTRDSTRQPCITP